MLAQQDQQRATMLNEAQAANDRALSEKAKADAMKAKLVERGPFYGSLSEDESGNLQYTKLGGFLGQVYNQALIMSPQRMIINLAQLLILMHQLLPGIKGRQLIQFIIVTLMPQHQIQLGRKKHLKKISI